MIRTRLTGNLGNQMFQAAFGYLTAKKLDTKFLLDNFHVHYQLNYFKLVFPFSLLRFKIVLKVYNKIQRLIKLKYDFDYSGLLEDASAYTITDNANYGGYYQDAALYIEHKQALTQFFLIRDKYKKIFDSKYGTYLASKKKIITVSIRLGDYKQFFIKELDESPALLPLSWYESQLKELSLKGSIVFVISDDIEEAKKKFIISHDQVVHVKDHMIMQFQLLLHSDICIISNSTFAWWGGFLNNKQGSRVIAPLNWIGYNGNIECPKGIMKTPFEWKK